MPRGEHSGVVPPSNHCLCPPNENCALQSQDCAPKIVTGSQPLEYSSRPETPKILTINPESVSKDRFFADSVVKTIFFCLYSRIRGNKILVSPQNCLCPPPSLATLAPGLSGKTLSICYNLQATECGNLKFILNTKIL